MIWRCELRRALAIALTAWLPSAAQDKTTQDPTASLRISVVEGEGATYAPGGRGTRGVTVEVDDPQGNPVPAATVTFRLPASGPSGQFLGGSRSESIATGADGRASAWGVQWNRTPGRVEIAVTAAKGASQGSALAHVVLNNSVQQPRVSAAGSAGSHKLLWILIVAGGGGAAAAVMGLAGKSAASSSGATSNSSAAVNAPVIGTPTISIGHP